MAAFIPLCSALSIRTVRAQRRQVDTKPQPRIETANSLTVVVAHDTSNVSKFCARIITHGT
jgi:hypothetical protein